MRTTTATIPPQTTSTDGDPSAGSQVGLLCAYSPRWLSGPTPGYRGLCPTWSDEPTAELERISVS